MQQFATQVFLLVLVAAITWIVVEFFGRPFRNFYNMRGEAIGLLIKFGNVQPRMKLDGEYGEPKSLLTSA